MPAELTPAGYFPAYSDDSSIHCGVHGPFSDERLYFSGNLLRAGQNTITINMNGRGLTNYLMVDYLRLELSGYVPPAPSGVIAFAGNQSNLVMWPVVPGATSYDIFRSVAPSSGYTVVSSGKPGWVCGIDALNMTYLDSTAQNGTQYYYRIVSKNPKGQSAPSPSSAGVTPAATLAITVPRTPTGLEVRGSGHHSVALNWTASDGANYYRVWRSTLHGNGVGAYYSLRTILLNDLVKEPSFIDTTPTDGKRYRYEVQAVNACGASGPSTTVDAVALPKAPAAPESFTAEWGKSRQGIGLTLKWSPVPGATGYVIYRSTEGEKFVWPTNYVTSLLETTWTDTNKAKKKNQKKGDDHMDASKDYYYQVTAINAGGVSPPVTTHIAAEESAAGQ